MVSKERIISVFLSFVVDDGVADDGVVVVVVLVDGDFFFDEFSNLLLLLLLLFEFCFLIVFNGAHSKYNGT